MSDDKPQTHDLHTFMAQVSQEMATEYQRIFAKSADDPGTAGDEGEENWATLLREWLPSHYHVRTKGRIIGADGAMSPQADVFVLKPAYPPKLLDKKVWLAGGVVAVFECKNTLKAEHLASSVERAVKFKKLFKPRVGTPRKELFSPLFYGVLAHSHSWKSPKSDPVSNVENVILNFVPSHPRDFIDFVCVADLGSWYAMRIPFYQAVWSPDREALTSVFGAEWGVMTSIATSTFATLNQHPGYQPIGHFLSHLTQFMAWEDPSIRDIADYYRLAQLWGSGGGTMTPWPRATFTEQTLAHLPQKFTNVGMWDEWSMALL